MVSLDRRLLLKASAAAAAVGIAGVPAEAEARPLVGKVLARKMKVPWGIAFLPNGNALVSERNTGRIWLVSRKGGKRKVATIGAVANNAGEGGLLGLATHPNFAVNRWVYAYFTSKSDNRVVRFKYQNGSIGPRHAILKGIPRGVYPYLHHNGGRLAFGPDGKLYISTGDAYNTANAQNKGSLAGKILRINDDGTIPGDNPFGSAVWTYGHRNVEGLAFDSGGQLWATEFGEKKADELNKIVKGDNYGWPTVEGHDSSGTFHNPFVTWSPTSTCSPSGVAITKNRAWIGALQGECVYSVVLHGPNKRHTSKFFAGRFRRIRTVQEAPDGSLWITTSNRDGRGPFIASDDRVIRIRFG